MMTSASLVALSLCLAGQGTAAESEPVEDAVKVLVLSIKATAGVSDETAQLLDDLVTVELSKVEGLDVISDADVRQLVELEAERVAVGCEMDSSCLAEIAGAMGAQFVVSGRIGQLGSRTSLTFNLYDSHKASSVGRTNIGGEEIGEIADALPDALTELIQPLLEARAAQLARRAGKPVPESTPESAETEPPEAEPSSSTETAMTAQVAGDSSEGLSASQVDEGGLSAFWWLAPAVLASGAVAVGAVAAGVDLGLCFYGPSCNGQWDATDFIGPAILGTAAGILLMAAGTALLLLFL